MSFLNFMNLKLYFLYSSIVEEGVVVEDIFPGWLQSGIESTMLTGFGVIGQSWDVYSDMGLAYQLATGTYIPACIPPEYVPQGAIPPSNSTCTSKS